VRFGKRSLRFVITVCENIGFRGHAAGLPPGEAELLALHDETTKARSGLPLA